MHLHHYDKHAASAQPGSARTATKTQAATALGDKRRDAKPVSADDIRLSAYRKWESAGRPTGDGVQFWLEAEQELARNK